MMFDPTAMIFNGRWGYVTRHEGADYMRRADVPWQVRFNPLRLQIGIGRGRPCRIVINRGGRWNRKLSDLTWRLWRRRRWEREEAQRQAEWRIERARDALRYSARGGE